VILPPNVSAQIDLIKNDRLLGARELAVKALNGLRSSIDQFHTDNEKDLEQFLLTASKGFVEARPSMISIANSISTVLSSTLKTDVLHKGLRASVIHGIDLQLITLERAFGDVISNAANIVTNDSTVVTCSYSSTVIEALVKAKRLRKSFKVLALHSPSSDGSLDYGVLTCRKLHEADVECDLVNESSIVGSLKVHIGFVGADSIYPDGSVLNGSPTLRLAQEDLKHNHPFYVVSETWKINSFPLLGLTPTIESGMDIVPTEFITAIVTESGLLKPRDVNPYAIVFSKRLEMLSRVSRSVV